MNEFEPQINLQRTATAPIQRIWMPLLLFFPKFSQTWFNMKEKKRSLISTLGKMLHSHSSIMLPHCSGFYRKAGEKMKYIAAGIWHFGLHRENPMATFEMAHAAAFMQLKSRDLGKSFKRFKLLTSSSHLILLDYSLILLKFGDLDLSFRCRTALCCRCEIIWIQTGQTGINHLDFSVGTRFIRASQSSSLSPLSIC